MADPVALLALALDAAIGWPAALYRRVGHPVGGFARIIDATERRWNDPARSAALRRMAGVATVVLLIAISAGTAWIATVALTRLAGDWSWLGIALLAAPGLAQRSLHDHVVPVGVALDARDVPSARTAVARIVGRDVATLDEAGVARAAIESLSESFCDGVVAPLLWLIVGGLPGIWVYKAINTADSMIGHREPRWRAFGWAAARADDVLNYLPARIAAATICLAGGGGWRTWWRDGGRHASPNSGRPEAAMAGALGIRLGGPTAYDGAMLDKPWIGGGGVANAADIRRGLDVYRRACVLLWIIAGGVAWAR